MLTNKPLISIIVPVYNVGRFLRPCLDSILFQTYPNFEAILINDGSTDGSGDVCDEYASKDPRFRVFHKENAGVSAARNSGLDLAEGAYIAFVDSDDLILPDYLQVLYEDIVENGVDASFCNYVMADEQGGKIPVDPPRFAEREAVRECEQIIANATKWGVVWGGLLPAEQTKRFRFTGLHYGEDSLFMFDLLRSGLTVYLDTYPGYVYLQRGSGATATNRIPNILKERDRLVVHAHRYWNLPEISEQVRHEFLVRYATQMHKVAYLAAQPENKQNREVCTKLTREQVRRITPLHGRLTGRLGVTISLYRYFPWLYNTYALLNEQLRRRQSK